MLQTDYDPVEGDKRSLQERPKRQVLSSPMTGSGNGATGRGRPMIPTQAVLLLWAVLLNGCDAPHGTRPCEGLVYKEYGLSQEEYRPCAAAMVAALNRTEQHLVAVFNGEEGDRSEALREVRLLKKMIVLAGGRKMFGESWNDESLNRLNRAIANACWQYEAAALAPGNHTDFENGRKNHAEATRILRKLH